MIKQNDSLININVTQKRQKRKTQKSMNLPQLPQLLSTETILLNVIGPITTKTKSSTDLNVANVIENKRTRQPNSKYALVNIRDLIGQKDEV